MGWAISLDEPQNESINSKENEAARLFIWHSSFLYFPDHPEKPV
jgi:hypothetical protein